MSKRLSPETPSISLVANVEQAASASGPLSTEVQELAQQLINIHGAVKIAQEASGLHMYLACPQCLQENGMSELYKRHLAINVNKYYAGHDKAVLCMKCGYKTRVSELQFMPTLNERGIEYKPEAIKTQAVNPDYLEKDAAGNMVPKGPGKILPLSCLPADHTAHQYLNYRGFNARLLEAQFQCAWCIEENPNLFYRRQPGGFRVTPQGRLIFFCAQNHVRVGWQARIPEIEEGNGRFFWHPYRNCWVEVFVRDGDQWVLRDGFEEWDPAKYFTAPGTRRSQVVMGFDAAMSWNRHHNPNGERLCGLVEGPLDAARLGPPFLCIMGKTLSAGQAELVAQHFHKIIGVRDNDAAGEKLVESMSRHFHGKLVRHGHFTLPGRFKDPGSLSESDARAVRFQIENQWRQL